MIWLLDTTTIIYALKYQGGVRERINLAGLLGEQLVTSAVVAAELLYGAERSARPDDVHPDRPNVPAERAALVAYLMRL